ncbi:MAG TPA: molybdopterin-dependent oxidoreductase [Caulobacteraceae bacterium]
MKALLLALALALAPVAALADITVTALNGQVTTMTDKDLADLPRATATLHNGDKATTYDGVVLSAILRASGTPVGPRAHGAPMHAYVEVTGADGYRVVLSLAETDPEFRPNPIVLADSSNGASLDLKSEGPYRLVITDDLKPWRAVKHVVAIAVKTAP